MRVLGFLRAILACLLLVPGVAAAEDFALILGDQGQIGPFQDPSGTDASAFRTPLAQAGFRLIEPPNRNMFHMRLVAQSIEDAIDAGEIDRLVIVLMGPYANDGRDSWILANEAVGATRLTVGTAGFSMSALMDMAARGGIQSVVLASPGAKPTDLRQGLFAGLGNYEKDGRVTLVTGAARNLSTVLQGSLLQDGVSFADAARNAPSGVVFEGNLSRNEGLMGPIHSADPSAAEEQGFWNAVQLLDTKQAFRVYLKRYPNGQFRNDARARIDFLQDEPKRKAEAAEATLRLSLDDRRKIQRNLVMLGFDTRGIDGVFGRGSRAAIAAWQRKNGHTDNGFINGNQVVQLRQQAEAEASRQQSEAEARRLEDERKDRAFWRNSGKRGTETGLRAYLGQYPDGLFSQVARTRLQEIEDDRRNQTARWERDAWDKASNRDTLGAYQDFLNTYPQSGFAAAARARINDLNDQQANAQVIAQAKAEEGKVAKNEIARVVIEQRLSMLGSDPGKIDGKFTEDTRKAIRQFQRSRNMTVTGYIDRNTMVRLMSGR